MLRAFTIVFTMVMVVTIVAGGCSDLRDYEGEWHGPRIGDTPVVTVGVGADAFARLSIDTLDQYGLTGTLSVDELITSSPIASIPGAEADALAGTTFTGSPLRVYFTFSNIDDNIGQALVLVALYSEQRVEVRILRGAPSPIYAIFSLQPGS